MENILLVEFSEQNGPIKTNIININYTIRHMTYTGGFRRQKKYIYIYI